MREDPPAGGRPPDDAVCRATARIRLSSDARRLWAASLEALLVVDDERRYVVVNEHAARLLGAPVERVLKRRIEDFTPREQWPRMLQLWEELQARGHLRGKYEVLKEDGSRVLIEYSAVHQLQPGRHLIAARMIAPRWTHGGRPPRRAPAQSGAPAGKPALTRRETEILQLAAEGRLGPEIATLLFISPSTVKTHLERIYRKLGARDRASAVAMALRLGIID